MKKSLLIISGLALVALASCTKNTVQSTTPITSVDVANIVGGSLSANSGGFTTMTADVAVKAQTTACGSSKADSATHQNVTGATTTYFYKYKILNTLNCNTNNQADIITSALGFNGNFNGPFVAITASGTSNFTFAGLTPQATVYTYNGEFKSTATYKLKRDTTNTGTVTIDLVVKGLVITKSSVTTPSGITAGTATLTVTGTSKNGAINFTGTLTYNANATATVVLAGTTYIIDLTTGVATKQ